MTFSTKALQIVLLSLNALLVLSILNGEKINISNNKRKVNSIRGKEKLLINNHLAIIENKIDII